MDQSILIPVLQLVSTQQDHVSQPPPSALRTMKLDMSSTCNIACDYCFVDEGRALPGPKLMKQDTIAQAISWFSSQHRSESSAVVLFGGEPLLNRKGVAAACNAVGDLRRDGQDIRLQLITNGMLASEEVCAQLAYAEASVMISVDGSQEVHDGRRRDHSGSPTYERVMSGLKNLQARIPADRIWIRATMSEGTSHVGYFDSLVQLGIKQISLGYIDETPPADMTAADYQRELDEIMVRVISLAKSGTFVKVHPFWTYLSLIYGELGLGQTWPRYDCGAATRIVSVTPDGDIYPCEHAVVVRNKHDWSLGSVWTGMSEASVKDFLNETSRTHQGCNSCGSSTMCDQGCRVDSTIADTRDECDAAENFLLILWRRTRYWYKKLADENPSLLLQMVDDRAYQSLRKI